VWWGMSVIPALWRLREEDCIRGQPGLHSEFQARLGYIMRPYLKKKKKMLFKSQNDNRNNQESNRGLFKTIGCPARRPPIFLRITILCKIAQ
jgi:hypothetical protein